MPKSKDDALKVLITGSEGFTGKYMRAEMEEFGYEVYRSGVSSNKEASNYFILDLLNENSIRICLETVQPDIIIHLAAIAYVGHNNVRQIYEVNTIGTRNLLAITAELNIQPKSILIASSANVYGNSNKSVLSEKDDLYPANDYAVSKLAMEYIAKIWMDQLPIIITRPFNYTGVGQQNNFLIPKIIEHFKLRKKEIELGNINVYREFNDVRFVVRIYRQLIEKRLSNFICNVCTGKEYSLKNIISICENYSNYRLTINVNPSLIRKNEIEKLCGNNQLLLNTINNELTFNLNDTLYWMLNN